MPLTIPNQPHINKTDPKLGEALKQVQNYINQNVATVPGNKATPPNFVNPSKL